MTKLKDRKIYGFAISALLVWLAAFYFVGCGGKDGDRSDRYRYNNNNDRNTNRLINDECRTRFRGDQSAINLCIDEESRNGRRSGRGNGDIFGSNNVDIEECERFLIQLEAVGGCYYSSERDSDIRICEEELRYCEEVLYF